MLSTFNAFGDAGIRNGTCAKKVLLLLRSCWRVNAIKTEKHTTSGEQQYEEERKNNALNYKKKVVPCPY